MSADYDGRQFVGIDLHRRRSVIVRTSDAGEVLETVRIVNDADSVARVLHRSGEAPEVVLEATYGWYWAADVIAAAGANTHLAHFWPGVSRPSATSSATRAVDTPSRAAAWACVSR